MVFSFFKKQAEKMPERQAAKPRPSEPLPEVKSTPVTAPEQETKAPVAPLPDLEFTPSKPGAAKAEEKAADDGFDDGFDDEFSAWSSVGINVDHDVDPLEACVEQVAVLFANGQDASARSVLETFLQAYPGPDGKRFWLMLFDLLQVQGDRAAFDKLGVEYVHACETSPPAWRDYNAPRQAAIARSNGMLTVALQGVLTEDNLQPIVEIRDLLQKKTAFVIDCAKFIGCDDEVAEQLVGLLVQARKAKLAVTLADVDGILKRLSDRAVVGESGHEPVWRLLLELLQRHGTQEVFEERAVDYAITFELSPPSWEVLPQSAMAAPPEKTASRADDAYYLSGELKNYRFDDLIAVLDGAAHPVLDFSDVSRLDFVSAGQLVNRLVPYKAQGKEIIIRSPNRLVAELMAVVGVNKQARIIVPKS